MNADEPPARPSRRGALLAAGAATLAAPAVARAAEGVRWRMATSWPRNLPGPGISAARLARRIGAMSGGAFIVDVFAAGEIVPAFNVLDAVGAGGVEMGHTAALFWEGKAPGASIFTTAPFGLGPIEHQAWIEKGGGQALWDELYRPFGAKGFLAGNTGPSMGGWFRRELKSFDEVKGMRIRVTGLGAEVYARLGATPMAIPPGDTYVALERGTIDAVEVLAPVNDLPQGFQKVAPFYYLPGFNKPNGAGEALVGLRAWEKLPPAFKEIVAVACAAEHSEALAEASASNAQALIELVSAGARLAAFPPDMLAAARQAADEVIGATAARSPVAGRIVESYRRATAEGQTWASLQARMAHAIRP